MEVDTGLGIRRQLGNFVVTKSEEGDIPGRIHRMGED